MSTNVCQRDVFINSYKLTKIIKWKKVINTEITSGHFGRKKKRARSQSTSVNYYIRFLKTDKVRPKEKTSKEKTPVSLKQKAIYIEFMQRHGRTEESKTSNIHIQLLFPKAEHGHVMSTS